MLYTLVLMYFTFLKVKCLCRDWFPIDYPDTWYQEITSNPRFFSLAATLQGSIIGLIVAETKELGQLAKEDRSLLANCFLSNTKVDHLLDDSIINMPHRLDTSSHLACARHTENRGSRVSCWTSSSPTLTTTPVTPSRPSTFMSSPRILRPLHFMSTGDILRYYFV